MCAFYSPGCNSLVDQEINWDANSILKTEIEPYRGNSLVVQWLEFSPSMLWARFNPWSGDKGSANMQQGQIQKEVVVQKKFFIHYKGRQYFMKLLFQLYMHISVCTYVYMHIYIWLSNVLLRITVLKKKLINMMTKKPALWCFFAI